MRIVLDTGVFYHPDTLRRATRMVAQVIVPAVVFMERARQLQRDGGDVDAFAHRLGEDRYVVEPFHVVQATRYAVGMGDDKRWRRHYRDGMIAGHVESTDELWTTNRRDFELIGVPPGQIHDVP